MRGKTVVITGATSGIGEVAAMDLAAKGARIIAVARDPRRGSRLLAALSDRSPGIQHSVHYADLSLIAETKRVGREIAQVAPQIDVLVNNAGAIFYKRLVTTEGLELTFALNFMAYFVLTDALWPNLAQRARIVNTASSAHKLGRINWQDLQSERSFSSMRVYGTAKLQDILFTRELARRGAAAGITANSFHPGLVATRFSDEADGGLLRRAFVKAFKAIAAISPEKGAATLIYLASSPDVAGVSGEYFYKCRPARIKGADEASERRLWDLAATLASSI